jgi:hypothetical protein
MLAAGVGLGRGLLARARMGDARAGADAGGGMGGGLRRAPGTPDHLQLSFLPAPRPRPSPGYDAEPTALRLYCGTRSATGPWARPAA